MADSTDRREVSLNFGNPEEYQKRFPPSEFTQSPKPSEEVLKGLGFEELSDGSYGCRRDDFLLMVRGWNSDSPKWSLEDSSPDGQILYFDSELFDTVSKLHRFLAWFLAV